MSSWPRSLGRLIPDWARISWSRLRCRISESSFPESELTSFSSRSTRTPSSQAEAALAKLLVLFLLPNDLLTTEYLGSSLSSARLRKGVEVESSMAGMRDMYQVYVMVTVAHLGYGNL